MKLTLALLSLVLVVPTAGCSLVFMRDLDADPDDIEACVESREMPWIDTGVAGVFGAIGLGTAISAAGASNKGSRLGLATISLAASGAFAYSALRGFGKARECRASKAGGAAP